jgi:hypothetical protein
LAFLSFVSFRVSDETILRCHETIFYFGAELWKQLVVTSPATKTAGSADS